MLFLLKKMSYRNLVRIVKPCFNPFFLMFSGISLVILNNLSISKVKRRKMICEIVNIVNRIFFINVAILVLYCCEKIMTMATLIKENIYLVLAYSSTQRFISFSSWWGAWWHAVRCSAGGVESSISWSQRQQKETVTLGLTWA